MKGTQLAGALLRAQSDARLTRLAAEGYETAFETLVHRYRGSLQRYCRRFLPDALVEEVVQQAFLELWSALEAGDEIRDARAWLYRVVHNAALNTIRRGGYRCEELQEAVVGGADSPDVAFERGSALRDAFAGLVSLPSQQREALMRSAVDGDSRAQIALAMGVSDGAVGQLLHRARVSMRAAMTALIPWPLAAWAAGGGHYDAATATRVAELTSGGGGGAADALLKGGAALAVAAVASTAPLAIVHVRAREPRRPQPVGQVVPVSERLESGLGSIPLLTRTTTSSAGTVFARSVPVPRALALVIGASTPAPSVGAGAALNAASTSGAGTVPSTGTPIVGQSQTSAKISAPPP